ncbi:MAG: SDR family oxidoreductase, partial [Phycisphaeraceae bacterium]
MNAVSSGKDRAAVADGKRQTLLLTGATGYIGGRLAKRLLEAGYDLRCVVRSARKLAARPWANDPRVAVIEGDLGDVETLTETMRGCTAAYYLVHSMQAVGAAYAEEDRRLAEAFATAAVRAGVARIIYLGGLGEIGDQLSEHLSSRRHVEQALASGKVPVTVLRAAMIIGSGSASFEILRYLVERLPIMITPRWVHTEVQPIAVRNVIHDLVACLEVPETEGQTLDIGGPDTLTYRDLMQIAAEAMGLRRRLVIPVPVLTPRLSALWIHLVTPLPYRLAGPLGEGLRNRVVCRDDRAQQLMPQHLLGVREAIDAALGKLKDSEVETAWSDAGALPGDAPWAGGTEFVDERRCEISAPPDVVFQAVCRLGGSHGWYAADWLWRCRGAIDRLFGGPGLRRGRRHPQEIGVGDALDFWRVTEMDRPRRLLLHAEMKLPGEATLAFDVQPLGDAGSTLTQTARFRPRGLAWLAYWYAVS